MRPETPLILALSCLGLLPACQDNAHPTLNGYVEAEPIRVAASQAGRLSRLSVARGDTVQVGQTLFVLDQERERAAVQEAEARLAQAHATRSDLESGQRPDEVAVREAAVRAAQAALKQSDSELRRHEDLAERGFVARSMLDSLRARRDADRAQLNEAQAQLRVAHLAARAGARAAAGAGAEAAAAQLAQQRWALEQKVTQAPVAARVEDSYYRTGEWVPAGSPVLSLLAPGAVKVRFFVPETERARLKPGGTVEIGCDGCGAPLRATVRFVARDAEFTPPLIYSKENRARLVWLAEAVPAPADAARLLPGQPVDVRLP